MASGGTEKAGHEDIPGFTIGWGAWIGPIWPDVAGRFATGAPCGPEVA